MDGDEQRMQENFRRMVQLTEEWLARESPEERESRMKTLMARAVGERGRWRMLMDMTDAWLAQESPEDREKRMNALFAKQRGSRKS